MVDCFVDFINGSLEFAAGQIVVFGEAFFERGHVVFKSDDIDILSLDQGQLEVAHAGCDRARQAREGRVDLAVVADVREAQLDLDVLTGLAEELTRIELRALDLIEESDPRSAEETIEQWEEMLGLPDEQQQDH